MEVLPVDSSRRKLTRGSNSLVLMNCQPSSKETTCGRAAMVYSKKRESASNYVRNFLFGMDTSLHVSFPIILSPSYIFIAYIWYT